MALYSCGQSDSETASSHFTSLEKEILTATAIDKDVLSLIRNYTDSSFSILHKSHELYNEASGKYETVEMKNLGFTFNASEMEARKIVISLMNKVRAKGCTIYTSESNFGNKPDKISVIKGVDQMNIIKIEATDGVNHGIENSQIIDKLKQWNTQYPLQITGASHDWVEAVFLNKPNNVRALANEIYEFCPDVVDQGTGTIEGLEQELKRTQSLYLWWD